MPVVAALLRNGASAGACDEAGRTPLHALAAAVPATEGQQRAAHTILNLLLRCGAQVAALLLLSLSSKGPPDISKSSKSQPIQILPLSIPLDNLSLLLCCSAQVHPLLSVLHEKFTPNIDEFALYQQGPRLAIVVARWVILLSHKVLPDDTHILSICCYAAAPKCTPTLAFNDDELISGGDINKCEFVGTEKFHVLQEGLLLVSKIKSIPAVLLPNPLYPLWCLRCARCAHNFFLYN